MTNSISENPRRTPEAHFKSLEFDPDRKILVVEGLEDRLFLEYLCGKKINKNAIILEIETVEINSTIYGGNRGRIIHFAGLLKTNHPNIKFLVDKDYSQYTNEKLPLNTILTDFKDLEGYLYKENYIDKFLKIGIKTDKINSSHLLKELYKAKFFGYIRLTSLINDLNLSVNKTNKKITKYIKVDSLYKVTFKENDYLISLIQNSTQKPKLDDLKDEIVNTIEKFKTEENNLLVHGKDVLAILKSICIKLGNSKENIENIFWMCFDSNDLNMHPNLKGTVDFLNN
jgi:hypothetical protein